jgi:S1-C subfamily serine protease
MINSEGQVIRCSSYGWGIIGGSMAIHIFNDCIASHKQMGFIEVENVGVPGFYLREGDPPSISQVQPGGPAEKAGMLAEDKIISVNGQKVKSMKEVLICGFCKPGEIIKYEIQRGEEVKLFSVVSIPKARKLE